MNKQVFPIFLGIITVLFGLVLPNFAQATRAAIYGTISDPNGAVIQGAIVTATQEATNLKFTTNTNSEGDYRLPLLPVGDYEFNRHLS